jgi:AsmA protein
VKKFLIISAAILLVLIISLTIFIKIYVTPDRVRDFLIPTAESTLNRKISVGDLNISLIKGISVKDFAIKEKNGKEDFLRCKDFILRFQLLPLLSKRIIVDELKLASPEVSVVRASNGKYNFEGIGQKPDETAKKKTESDGDTAGLPISLLVNKVTVKDAKLSFKDFIKELPDVKTSFDINISLESVSSSELVSKGTVDVRLDEMVTGGTAPKVIRDIVSALSYAVKVNLASQDVHIDKADLKVQNIPVSIKGNVKSLNTQPSVDLDLNLPKAKARDIQEIVAPFADVKDMNLSGSIAAHIKVSGLLKKLDTLKAKGEVTLEKFGLTYEGVDALLDGAVKFDEKVMNLDLKTTIDKNSARLKGKVTNYFKNQDINLNVYAEKLHLDSLVPVSKKETSSTPKKGKTPGDKKKEAEPVNLTLSARGEIKIDSAVYKGMNMNNFYARYEFKKNRLKISEMTADAGKGNIALNGYIDLSKPGYIYNVSSKVDSIHADELVNSFFPKAKDTIFGMISLNMKMKGKGTLPETMKKNLKADGDFNIKDGKITDTGISEKLSAFLDVRELETITLKDARGTVNIRKGIARLDSLFLSDDLSTNPAGTIGLNERLNLAFDLKLSPQLTDKAMKNSSIARYMKNEEGWGMIPLIVSGTLSNPKFKVDVKKAGKRVISKEVDKQIDKLLDKKEDEKSPEKEVIQDLLKGIFK